MLKKVICVVAFLGIFAAVALTSDTAQAWGQPRTVWRQQPVMVVQPQPVWVVQQPVVARRTVFGRRYYVAPQPQFVQRPVMIW